MTGQQPIHFASAGGHIELIELLIDGGAPVNEEDKEGYTAMHLAAKYGHNSLIEILKSKISLSVVSSKVKIFNVCSIKCVFMTMCAIIILDTNLSELKNDKVKLYYGL